MADYRPSTAPMFNPGILIEDLGSDGIYPDHGANIFLGHQANHHDGQSTLGPRGNRVQDGAVTLLGTHSELGRPSKSNPLGAQNG